MKRLLKLFLLIILLFPTIVLGKDTCNPNDIVIKNISISDTTGFAEENTPSNIDNNKIITDLKMYNVGDSIEYNIQVENTSDEDYYFNDKSIKMDTEYLEYSLINGEEVIPPKTTKTVQLKVTYKNQIPDSSYEDTNKIEINISDKPIENPKTIAQKAIIMVVILLLVLSLSYTYRDKILPNKMLLLILGITIIPISVYATCNVKLEIDSKVVITNKEATFLPGEQVNIKMKQLAGDSSAVSSTPDTTITAIKYSEVEPTTSNKEEKNIVSTQESEYPIYMWFDNGTIYWWSEDIHPNMNENASNMFNALYNLSDISGLTGMDLSNTTNMEAMFRDNPNLSDIGSLAKWDISKVENMGSLFRINSSILLAGYQSVLEDLYPLKDWNTSSLTKMNSLFYNCTNIKSLNGLENWNTSRVEDMSFMFSAHYKYPLLLESIEPIKYWDTSNVTTMQAMFQNNLSLTSIDVSNWDVSNVTDMSVMFGATASNKISSLREIKGLDKWDTSNVTNMQSMFTHQVNLRELDLSSWDTSKVTNMKWMFSDLNIEAIYVSNKFVTSQVTDSTEMFVRHTNYAGVLENALLVGGNGTRWDANHIDKEYARIDTNETPGYFTLKAN